MKDHLQYWRIANVRAPLEQVGEEDALRRIAARALHVREEDIASAKLARRAVDARDKGDVHLVLSIDIASSLRLHAPRGVQLTPLAPATPQAVPLQPRGMERRPLVVGLGPAGLFAGLTLARLGLRPLIVERGRDVDRRAGDIAAFQAGGPLDPSSNIQFGEGGAGAFSDGKLNTGISDPRCRQVLEDLVTAGAPEEILWDAKPHVGTDRLPGVVRAIRETILLLGGDILYETRLADLRVEDGRIRGAVLSSPAGETELDCDDVLLAVGHSARDTFRMLLDRGVPMERKPFSVGARIEHLQREIDRAQYGQFAGHRALGAADYKLSVRTADGRGVYTFCMCPGGTVVAAASEDGRFCTNGMSAYARDGRNANAALLVGVSPEELGPGDVLAGVRFQRRWEEAAYRLGGNGWRAPVQLTADFLQGVPSSGPGSVEPTCLPGVVWTDLSEALPEFVVRAMREGLRGMGRKLRGFDAPDAVLTGVETRSSSPVRILRGAGRESAVGGLWPCGEGAGYAGGILSAAVDGIRSAEALAGVDKTEGKT